VFSLTFQNTEQDLESFRDASDGGLGALRTCIWVRETDGNEALGNLYHALGDRRHNRLEDLNDGATVEGALADAGLPIGRYAEALADTCTFDTLRHDHRRLTDEQPVFGVPAIVLNDGAGPAIFGPVISNPIEDDQAARDMWTHIYWLINEPNFSELKRNRTVEPELESVREYQRNIVRGHDKADEENDESDS